VLLPVQVTSAVTVTTEMAGPETTDGLVDDGSATADEPKVIDGPVSLSEEKTAMLAAATSFEEAESDVIGAKLALSVGVFRPKPALQ
jgi:hypothetical protein